jgi:SpoVK/Ycf46/Vps4 family AAA+-type ATPase
MCKLVPPLNDLKNMVGMEIVKEHIVNQILFFLQGFDKQDKCNDCTDCSFGLECKNNKNRNMLHTMVTGPPGVGKTELGKILGKVYRAMGILSTGKIKIVKRSDLIAKYLGQTAIKTQDVIDSCKGGVMFIDEAYSLGNPEGRDSFSKECLDTLNQNLSERRDFLCIIAGYADALESSFFQYNEGLARRFTFRYDIEDYSGEELKDIFKIKVKKEGWKLYVNPNDKDSVDDKEWKLSEEKELINFFEKNLKYFPHFGGDIETLFLQCKIHHGRRVLFLSKEEKKILSKKDIEDGFASFKKNRKHDDKKNQPKYEMMYV